MFWRRGRKKKQEEQSRGEKVVGRGVSRRRFSIEVKLLAVKSRESGMSGAEVSQLVGASKASVEKWWRTYREGGVEGLVGQSTHHSTRKLCEKLEKRIEEYRLEHPDHGARRISQELRRNDGLEVSHGTVHRVLQDAGLSNPPVQSKRRPPQIRRFERELPNAMWQIDIFTFELKRMYRVYLVGMIDDHSRYIVGHGLYRQQRSEAVMVVVKGAIGQ